VRKFEQTLGVVENIDTTSRQLKQALEDGKTIIVTTLQKFPVIADQMGALKGKKFAVIIDEAHSSQSGESTKSLKAVLATNSLDEAEKQDGKEGDDLEDRIVAEMKRRGRLSNVSYFAFTATPKNKTLKLFGRKRGDGKFEPFSLYSMRQAIEEKFILDVLENYTTYQSYWALLKKIKDGGKDYTESGMNTLSVGKAVPETATTETFKQNEFRLLIVANKFQTGFDQPLLHTMYVDKKLGGVNAVQTLSRLNRICPPDKEDTMVLDFANEAVEIQKSFQPYYER